MKQLSKSEAEAFVSQHSTHQNGKPKTALRLAIEAIEPGENILLERGTDYEYYRNVYYIMRQVRLKTGRKFLHRIANRGEKILIVRTI